MRISIYVPRGMEDAFNRLSPEKKARVKEELESNLSILLKGRRV